jgi:hypothetical protein
VERGLPAVYVGYTPDDDSKGEVKTIVTLHDAGIDRGHDNAAQERPIAILSTYNEVDVIDEVGEDIIDQGCDLIAIDNWSTDGTWDVLSALASRRRSRVRIERFPAEGPVPHYEWRQILRRKEVIAREFSGRWVIHTDADELRRSPFPDLTLADGLRIAQRSGANRVNFNLINFRPTDERPFRTGTLKSHFSHFEYGTRPGHFKQGKAWLQGVETVDLVTSGGHSASFAGAVDFRYKFLLQHYPIRSAEHGRRKILRERQSRWSPEERAIGWHIQYDNFSEASSFLWAQEELYEFGPCFWLEHGLPIMTDIAEQRSADSLPRT